MLWLRFAHYLCMAAWFGGALTAMIVRMSSRGLSSPDHVALLETTLNRIHARVIAPGAVLTVISGFLIIASLVTAGAGEALGRPGVIIMQTAGLVAALLVLIIGLPTSSRLARIANSDAQNIDQAMKPLRRRQAFVSMSAVILFLLAMAGATVVA